MDQKPKEEERIVMTPVRKEVGHTVLRMERKRVLEVDKGSVAHEAGGNHKGIVINKQAASNGLSCGAAQLSLSFKVFLINAQTDVHTQESRQLRFWFSNSVSDQEQMHSAQDFFRDLVNPSDFPRDYVGFIMKVMKLLQQKYSSIHQMEVEMKQLEDMSAPPSRPISVDDSVLGSRSELTEQRVLEMIESSYPNAISVHDIANATHSTEEEAHFYIVELLAKNIIKAMDNGMFMRVTQNDTEVKLVKQMPKVVRSQQPTIAIITAQYCEKVAVDAMIENKDTYVKYKTEGESNVYTLGNIGWHRVVATKLPAVGHSRGAFIAAGNTTTRLLGTFQRVEYVFLVGVGGGVPHYTDFNQHVRLGDVVVSVPPSNNTTHKPFIYIHCDKIKNSPEERACSPNGEITVESFNYRTWCPPILELQEIARYIWEKGLTDKKSRTWEDHIRKGMETLISQESDFIRPPKEADKLYMSIGTKDVIEVGHPEATGNLYNPREDGMPKVHFGAVGSGRMVVRDEQIRQDVAAKFGIMAFDTEFDTVAESVFGNRKDRYMFIRGISDYKDGTRKKDWQPYSALAAAAFMKSVIQSLPPLED